MFAVAQLDKASSLLSQRLQHAGCMHWTAATIRRPAMALCQVLPNSCAMHVMS